MTAPAFPRRRLVDSASPDYRWWLLAVTSLGALLASLTSGTLVIALPDILRDLHTDLFSLLWIVVGYTIVTTVLVLNAGRLADKFGRARAYMVGMAVFTLASIGCGVAPDSVTLILGRVIQGVGGAFMFATSSALVTDAFPRRELGRALGINAMVVGAGLILGPILGGWLTSFGWRTVFWFNVPIGIVGGVALFVVTMPVLLWVESRVRTPLLDLSLFRDRLFLMGNLTGLLNGVARNGVLFLLVFYLQGAEGKDPVEAGIELAPLAIGLLVLSPISGALADRHGSRLLATAGMLVTAVGLAGLTTIQVGTPYWQLAIWQLVIGAGSGLFNSPNTSAVMGVVPAEKRGIGAGMRAMLTSTGFVISIALAIGLVTTSMDPKVLVAVFAGTQIGGQGIDLGPFIDALHLAFGAGVVVSLVGAAISMARGGHRSWSAEGSLAAIGGEELAAELVIEESEAGASI